jgi:hypothetical protein
VLPRSPPRPPNDSVAPTKSGAAPIGTAPMILLPFRRPRHGRLTAPRSKASTGAEETSRGRSRSRCCHSLTGGLRNRDASIGAITAVIVTKPAPVRGVYPDQNIAPRRRSDRQRMTASLVIEVQVRRRRDVSSGSTVSGADGTSTRDPTNGGIRCEAGRQIQGTEMRCRTEAGTGNILPPLGVCGRTPVSGLALQASRLTLSNCSSRPVPKTWETR